MGESSSDPWYSYYLASLYAGKGNYQLSYRLLNPMISKFLQFEEEAETVAAELTYFCIQLKYQNCDEIRKKTKLAINQRVSPWRQSKFLGRMSELGIEVK